MQERTKQVSYIQIIVQSVNNQLIDKEYVYQLPVDKLELIVEIIEYLQNEKKTIYVDDKKVSSL